MSQAAPNSRLTQQASPGYLFSGSNPRHSSMTTKEQVRDLLDRLPDDCSLDDVLYHLYVVRAIERGLADAEAGRTIPHEQVAEEMRRKWLLGTAG